MQICCKDTSNYFLDKDGSKFPKLISGTEHIDIFVY